MKLKILAGGYAQGVVTKTRGEVITYQILRGGERASGELRAHHHNELFPRLALVTVILLIDSVEFKKLVIILGKSRCLRIIQGLSDCPRQQRM